MPEPKMVGGGHTRSSTQAIISPAFDSIICPPRKSTSILHTLHSSAMDNTPTSPGEVTTLLQVLKMEPEKHGHLHHHHHHHQQHHHHHQHHPHHSCGRKSVDIRELLDCPVCTRPMYPPIHQCSNGHTLCSDCKPRVSNQCPTCRVELGNIRCLALEKMAAALELPCKYEVHGCLAVMPYYSKAKHESTCSFRPYACPYSGADCPVVGSIPDIVAHLRDEHSVDMHEGSTFNHRYIKRNPEDVENATWMLTVFHCFGQHFCLHFEAFRLGVAPVYMAFLRFMGEDSEAKNFSYSLEVGGHGRKLTWQGIPRSIRDSHRRVRDSSDGLIIHRNLALFFSSSSSSSSSTSGAADDRNELRLRIAGKIWREAATTTASSATTGSNACKKL